MISADCTDSECTQVKAWDHTAPPVMGWTEQERFG
jgi:hypothetical protein